MQDIVYTIIIVEDEIDVRERLIEMIEMDDKFNLLDASSSVAEGVMALEVHKPDILLTDLGLPDGSGIEIIKKIDIKNLKYCMNLLLIKLHYQANNHSIFLYAFLK